MSQAFLAGFIFMAIGYVLLSSSLQFAFYHRRAVNPGQWKVQPQRDHNLQKKETQRWWLPLLSLLRRDRDKNGRHPLHGLFATCNVLMASVFAGTVAHCIVEGKTRVSWDTETGFSSLRTAGGLALALAWQSFLEYYWHRLMHLRPVYARLHKFHHFYKAPEPFDDLMIHPLEACGYYLQLYSPPFFLAIPLSSFLLYMAVCGVCGVLDHSGVKLSVPGLYSTVDHDLHHSRFEVNYAFPFPFMDVLHGTYEGQFLGRRYFGGSLRSRRRPDQK